MAPAMNDTARPLILIVDDETAVRELLKLQLVGEGYDVRLADDPIVAGRSLREAPPDLMLVDLALPYQDGLDFAATLKADAAAPQVPIVFISGNPEIMSRARELGAPYLKKPFSATQLIDLVRRELKNRAPHRRPRIDVLSAEL
jgi:DNA-binding response OmpR family regulator